MKQEIRLNLESYRNKVEEGGACMKYALRVVKANLRSMSVYRRNKLAGLEEHLSRANASLIGTLNSAAYAEETIAVLTAGYDLLKNKNSDEAKEINRKLEMYKSEAKSKVNVTLNKIAIIIATYDLIEQEKQKEGN